MQLENPKYYTKYDKSHNINFQKFKIDFSKKKNVLQSTCNYTNKNIKIFKYLMLEQQFDLNYQ